MKTLKTIFLLSSALCIMSLTVANAPVPVKKMKVEFTEAEANIIYGALGKVPAEESEKLRTYIKEEYLKQLADTTKKSN